VIPAVVARRSSDGGKAAREGYTPRCSRLWSGMWWQISLHIGKVGCLSERQSKSGGRRTKLQRQTGRK